MSRKYMKEWDFDSNKSLKISCCSCQDKYTQPIFQEIMTINYCSENGFGYNTGTDLIGP